MVSWTELLDLSDLLIGVRSFKLAHKRLKFRKMRRLEKEGKFTFSQPTGALIFPPFILSVNINLLVQVFYAYRYTTYKHFLSYFILWDAQYQYVDMSRKCFYYLISNLAIYHTRFFSNFKLLECLCFLNWDNKLFIFLDSLLLYQNIHIFKWDDFDFMCDDKVILYEDFILRVPIMYMPYLGEYLEFCRRFKYHEYLSFARDLNHHLNIKYCLIDDSMRIDHIDQFREVMWNNNIQLFSTQYLGSHVDQIYSVVHKYNFVTKMYIYMIHFLSHINLYSTLMKYKSFTKIYTYKMCYMSWYRLLPNYHYFPRCVNVSLSHWFHRLILSGVDLLMFNIDFFMIDRLKFIDLNQKLEILNVDIYNVIWDIRSMNYIRFGWLSIIDYIKTNFLEHTHFLSMLKWYEDSDTIEEYLSYWLRFTESFFGLVFDIVDVPCHWEGDFLTDYFYQNRRNLDLLIWDVFRLAHVEHYNYYLYDLGDFGFWDIDKYHDNIYLLSFDIVILYFHNILNREMGFYKFAVYRFIEDLALKLLYMIAYNNRININISSRKLFARKCFILFNKFWLLHKKKSNFFIYYWQYIESYQDFAIMRFQRFYFLKNYKTNVLKRLAWEKLPEGIAVLDDYNNMIENRWAKYYEKFLAQLPFPTEFTKSIIIQRYGKNNYRRVWGKRGGTKVIKLLK